MRPKCPYSHPPRSSARSVPKGVALSLRALGGATDIDNGVMVGQHIHSTLAPEINALGRDLLTAKNPGLATPDSVLALPINAESTNDVCGCLGLRLDHCLRSHRSVGGAERKNAFGDSEERRVRAVVLDGCGDLGVHSGVGSRTGCGLESASQDALRDLGTVERLLGRGEHRDDCVLPRLFSHWEIGWARPTWMSRRPQSSADAAVLRASGDVCTRRRSGRDSKTAGKHLPPRPAQAPLAGEALGRGAGGSQNLRPLTGCQCGRDTAAAGGVVGGAKVAQAL